MKLKIKPVGERIALVNTDVNIAPGVICLPENSHRDYIYGQCIEVGNGRFPDGTTRKMYTQKGDVYIYQLDASQRISSLFSVDGTQFSLVHQADMICRLTSKDVSFDAVEMVGHWLLVEPYMAQSNSSIIIPETAKDRQVETHRFTLVKKGSEACIEAEVGDEVFPSRARLTPIDLGGKRYCFIQDVFVYGTSPSK